MAKLIGPLFSVRASGSVGPRLTYSQRKSCQQARYQKKQSDANTSDQQAERAFFSEALTHWAELNADEKSQWNTFNKG